MVAAAIRTCFVQEDHPAAVSQWRQVADSLRPRFPEPAELMDKAEQDVLVAIEAMTVSSIQIHGEAYPLASGPSRYGHGGEGGQPTQTPKKDGEVSYLAWSTTRAVSAAVISR